MAVAVDRIQSFRVAVDELLASCYQSFDASLRAFLARETHSAAAGIDLGSVRTQISGEVGGPGGIVDPPRPGVAAGMA